jgi:hypothetical protein
MNETSSDGLQSVPACRPLAKALAVAFALSLGWAGPVLGDVRILSSGGGSVGQYLDFFAKVRQSGERVVIDGPCLSACTLVLSSVPRKRVCVTSRAVLGFHAPFLVDDRGRTFRSREITQAVNAAYPANVRAWIKRHGGLTPKTILLKGRELNTLVPHC